MYRHSVRVVGFAFVAALWLSTGLMLAAFVYEVAWYDVTQWLAKARRAFNSPEPNAGKPNNLTYYRPFYPRYLHPIYLLYYPLDPDDRVALSNTVVSLTRDGFRGDAPDFTRQLMFILGGSAAFGYGASSDRTTISGYFNILQADVQAINAAVIGWNSTQELARFANQIASLKPHLVISYSLFNDIYVALSYATQGINLPPGSPLGFDSLSNIVRDLTPPSLKRKLIFSLENLFPRTTKLITGKRAVHSGNDIHPALDAAVDKFIDNEQMMYHISNDIGFTFVTVIQPILYAHNLPNLDKTGGKTHLHIVMLYSGPSHRIIAQSIV